MANNSFTKKELELTITLGTGEFGASVGDTVTIKGFRMMADLTNPGGESMGMAQIRVYGLKQPTMNQLTTIGQVNRAIRIKNSVVLMAGDATSKRMVFKGTIMDAWADYNSAPEVAFNILAYMGLDAAVKPVEATSIKGSVAVTTLMQKFANEAGLTLEQSNVNVQLADPYFAGTALDKIQDCARAANLSYSIDRGTLAIWPLDGTRPGGDILEINPENGLVGYPTLSSKGMSLRTLFVDIKFGSQIRVRSSIPMACGLFNVVTYSHNLSCEIPNGPWFTTVECINVGQ